MGSLMQGISHHVDRADIYQLLVDLIATPSVSPQDAAELAGLGIEPGESALAEFLFERLSELGIDTQLQEVVADRPNVVATVKGTAPGPALALIGHLDTIAPPSKELISLQPRIVSERIYGLGAADMKGGLTSMIIALETVHKLKLLTEGSLIFAGTIGEEGAPNGLQLLIEQGLTVDAAVVGEPTSLQVCIGQKGGQFVELRTYGRRAHGSVPEAGINAIDQMMKLLDAIRGVSFLKHKDLLFGSPTLNVGKIDGGARINVVPDRCTASVDVRIVPGVTPEDVIQEFNKCIQTLKRNDSSFEAEVVPSLPGQLPQMIPTDERIVLVAQKAVSEVTGKTTPLSVIPCWTDMGLLSKALIPAVILGPGSIEQAHATEEFVSLQEVADAAKIYALLALYFCSSDTS